MTRQEFIDEIDDFDALTNFCLDVNCSLCDDVYDEEAWNDDIDESLCETAQNNSWRDMLDILQEYYRISGCGWYRRDDYGEWYCLDDDDFTAYKECILHYGDDNDIWDDEEEEEEPTASYANQEDIAPLETEDISIDDLFLSGIEALQTRQGEDTSEVDFNSLFYT